MAPKAGGRGGGSEAVLRAASGTAGRLFPSRAGRAGPDWPGLAFTMATDRRAVEPVPVCGSACRAAAAQRRRPA